MNNQSINSGLGVFSEEEKVFLFSTSDTPKKFNVDVASDGYLFQKSSEAEIIDRLNRKSIKEYSEFHISKSDVGYLLTYKSELAKKVSLNIAKSTDLVHFHTLGKISNLAEIGMVVPNYKYKDQYVLFFGESSIKVAYSKDLKRWRVESAAIFSPDEYSNSSFFLEGVFLLDEGVLAIYFECEIESDRLWLRAALFDRDEPTKIIWQVPYPIWEISDEMRLKGVTSLGTVIFRDELISYLEAGTEGIFAVRHNLIAQLLGLRADFTSIFLTRIKQNPILKPIFNHFWESKAVFNAAAIYEDGKVHLIYRAIGNGDMSMLGYASSSDGINIDERLEDPIYTPKEPFERGPGGIPLNYSQFLSGGGGSGGSEDPRITKIDDRLYMTYVAFDGSNPPRVALTSIDFGDFLSHRWNWEKPVLISPPGVVDKNACILPEKINGKYVIFHRIYPDILVDFVNDLNFDGQTQFLKGEFKIKARAKYWDSRKVGVGAVPIKTKDGWLAIYQAVGDSDPSRYKIGAMLLSLDDPTCVVARSPEPILEPLESYENEGFKSGVVYPCGAVTIEDQLFVYYGGADTFVCAASANVNEFTKSLISNELPKLTPVLVRRVSN